MDQYEDDDEYDDMLLLEDIFDLNNENESDQDPKKDEHEPAIIDMSEVYAQNYEKLSREIGNEVIEYDHREFNDMVNLNKELMSYMLDVKKSVISALHKCEQKLKAVDTCLDKYAKGDIKVLAYNAGMPYFKDRSYFFAPNNNDGLIKEARGEMQINFLPKVCSWTSKERHTLLKAIRQEAFTNVLHLEEPENSGSDDMETNQEFLPKNFREMVGPLGSKTFDWLKISIHFQDRHPPTDCRGMWNSFLHPDINKSPWKKPENNKLKMIAERYNYQNWDKISEELGTNRTAYQCFIRYNTTKKLPTVTNCMWEPEEDDMLMKLVELFKIGDFVPWGEVASWMNNRTKQQVYYRWTYSLAPYLIKGRFTKLEDNVLKVGVTKYGTNFSKISAALMPNRSTVQLNDHYQRLAVDKKEHPNLWTAEDDKKLVGLFEELGPNWSTIAKSFSGKTRTQLRHRYSSIQRRKLLTLLSVDSDDETENFIDMAPVYNNDTLHNSEDFNDDVDKEIIEYFRATRMAEQSSHAVQFHDTEELNDIVKKLHDILQLLGAKLDIPDNIDDVHLNHAERQLLCALKEYMRINNDEQRKHKMIEKCSLVMFGLNYKEKGNSHFVPPLPYDTRVKLRKVRHTQLINYNLNENNNYLLDESTEIFTPDYVITSIGGEEQEREFQNLNRLMECDNSKYPKRNTVKKLSVLSPKILNQKDNVKRIGNVNGNGSKNGKSVHHSKILINKDVKRERKNAKLLNANNTDQELDRRQHVPFSLLEEPSYFPPVPYVEITMKEGREKESPALETTYATLQSFKNLMYCKRLYGPKERNINVPLNVNVDADALRDACTLLETRLERLFKYPTGLAKTELPQLYDTDMFSYDNIEPKMEIKRRTQNTAKRLKFN